LMLEILLYQDVPIITVILLDSNAYTWSDAVQTV